MITRIILLAAFAVFLYRRGRFALKFFQQESYHYGAFTKFIFRRYQMIDKFVSVPAIIVAILPISFATMCILDATILLVATIRERNPIIGARKPLVATARARRIFWTMFAIMMVAATAFLNQYTLPIFAIGVPFALMFANWILTPVERAITQKYLNQAREKLAAINPIVIGITGSFGKTSTKNILQHILAGTAKSYTTPRSINTIMGLTRCIRMELSPAHKYFIAEIGTSYPGEIAAIAEFVRPKFAMITSVAGAHFENFGSLDAIAREKFDIAKTAEFLLVNGANVDEKFITEYAPPKITEIYDDQIIFNLKQNPDGISFDLAHGGNIHNITAPIFGTHNAQNIAGAFIMARHLDVPTEKILAALRTLPQTEHRLEVRRENGITIIDDAFNSNMSGFLSALKTMSALRGGGLPPEALAKGGRAILITPGMVELGELHGEQHAAVGRAANAAADFVVAVKPERIPEFNEQIAPEKLVRADNLAAAQEWLAANARPGDVVLYENDLPDVFVERFLI
ncbi:MAG: UDP-N-acetylmuramoyl-tripeptide--D-alanyl-D-alanine ligase [Rickettsiales bacterium]|jgi:UDP-N-acetylmuramoyl-tripeptide--D-alanyl-D-alanine ligase|nr:UDP-N-acetylmuramoyl-tripeptide--D-alanyl-D-alanine ligase [Rickettsiales bacterium]